MITVLGPQLNTVDLKGVEPKRPERAGSRWRPIPHHDLAVTLEQELQHRGIAIRRAAWSLDPARQVLVGGFSVLFPAPLGLPDMPGIEYALGIRHGNNLKYALTFAAGAQVTVCLNGLVSGTWVLVRKHTCGLDLGTEVARGVDRFVEESRSVRNCIDRLRERNLTRHQADHALMDAGRARLLPWSHLGQVERLYEHPEHEDFRSRTAWSLMNAFNEVVKKQAPARQLHSLDRFRQLLLN